MRTWIVLSLGASLVSAGCFTSGESWGGDRSAALAAAQTLCQDGTLSGTYFANQSKFACVNLSSQKKVDFRVAADNLILQGDSINLGVDDCTANLEREINGCGQGGQSQYSYSDPTSGDFQGDLTFT